MVVLKNSEAVKESTLLDMTALDRPLLCRWRLELETKTKYINLLLSSLFYKWMIIAKSKWRNP
jgi:hypothetical protein